MAAPGSKYDILRSRASQAITGQQQQESDALKRRFAAQGMAGSGAAIKSEMVSQDAARKQVSEANQNIGFQESAEQEQRDQIEAQRKFAREERVGSQNFSSGESALARRFAADQASTAMKFQTTERMGSQKFQDAQATANRKVAREQFRETLAQQSTQFDASMSMEEKKFAEELRVNEFNMDLAESMSGNQGMFGGLLGGLTGGGGGGGMFSPGRGKIKSFKDIF